jgi:hypothetical protein
VPEYLKEEADRTISELNVGKDMQKIIEEFNQIQDDASH